MARPLTFKVYDFTLTAGGSYRLPVIGEYFRIQTSNGALDVTVEGVGTLPGLLSGQALKDVPFNGLVLRDASGAPNVGTILVASSEFQDNRLQGTVDLSATSLAALESIDLTAATQNNLIRPPESNGTYSVGPVALAANTAVQVFAPGSNPNGALLLSASMSDQSGTANVIALLSKASAPTSVTDGEVYLHLPVVNASCFSQLNKIEKIPPGHGLYFIATVASSTNASVSRNCRYRLL